MGHPTPPAARPPGWIANFGIGTVELQVREAESEERGALDESREDDRRRLDLSRSFRLARDPLRRGGTDGTDSEPGTDHGTADSQSSTDEAGAAIPSGFLNRGKQEVHLSSFVLVTNERDV